MIRGLVSVLLAGAMALTSSQAFSQTAPSVSRPAATDVAPVTVVGSRANAADAQRIAACAELLTDPQAQALMAAGAVFAFGGRTRPPKNPDYNAPPMVPLDAPMPELDVDEQGASRASIDSSADPDSDPAAADDRALTLAAAVAACRGQARSRRPVGSGFKSFSGEKQSNVFWSGLSGARSIPGSSFTGAPASGGFRRAGSTSSKPDTTLPMAMALFDQGRYRLALDAAVVAHKTLGDIDGGDEAALMIGKIYLHALGEQSNPYEAVKWLKWAAASHFDPRRDVQPFDPKRPDYTTAIGEASMILAEIYAKGHDPIPADPAQSRKYLERAIETGYIPASKALGDVYYEGKGTPKDLRKAFRHYMDAATYAYAPAAMMVARMHAEGDAPGGVDLARAAAWNNEAAKFNDPDAIFGLAVAYDRGEGVTPDPERALGFYKVAATDGHPAAQAAIGTYFYTGERVPQDLEVARGWFEQSAFSGDPDGMVNLAAMMAKGEGGEIDRARAWGWLKIAERQGHPTAGAAARAVEAKFTPDDTARVDALKRDAAAPPPPPYASLADPAQTLASEFIGSAAGGPAWWKVSKGEREVWIFGLAPRQAPETLRWNTRPLRSMLRDARLLAAPYSPQSRLRLAIPSFRLLPNDLGDRVTAAAVRIRAPLRNREATLSDAVMTHQTYYRRNRLSALGPSDVYQIALRRGIVTPPRRPGPSVASIPTSGPDVEVCVEAILEDINVNPATTTAAATAWARGDVAGALAGPRGVDWACRLLWPDYWEENVGFQVEAIALALDMPGKVVVVSDLGHLLAQTGILKQLRDRGYAVSGPMQPPAE